jgi:transcriptional regulator with XRE-family HTH domain
MDDLRVGERLRTLRKQRKLTLRALSRASGQALSYLSALENGKNSITWPTSSGCSMCSEPT